MRREQDTDLAGVAHFRLRVVPGEVVASRVQALAPRWRLRRTWPSRSRRQVAARVLAVLVAAAAAVGVVWLVVQAVIGLVAAVVALVALVVAWVQAHVWHLVLTAALLLFVVVRARAGRSSCAGLHCRGCRR